MRKCRVACKFLKEVVLDWSKLTVLLTGGTGSFGQKFTDLLLKDCHPKRLIIFGRDELKQSEMSERIVDPAVAFLLGDVRDRDRLFRAMDGVMSSSMLPR